MVQGKRFCVGSALTAQGVVDFWESNLSRISRALVFQSLPGLSLPSVLEDCYAVLEEAGVSCEAFLKARGPAELACVVVEDRTAILDSSLLGTARLPGEAARTVVQVPLRSLWDADQRQALQHLHHQACRSACLSLQRALQIHDEWEAFHIEVMRREKAAELAKDLALELFPMRMHRRPRVRHRFLGASTATGPVDCIESATAGIPKRIFLKGRPGTGKSTLLKKLASAAAERGLDHDLYHCSFDSHSMDMLVVPEAEVALMDATAPHEYEPSREGDSAIDLYELLIPEGTDEAHAEELSHVVERYRDEVAASRRHMTAAQDLLTALSGGVDIEWSREDTGKALEAVLG